MSDYSTYPAWTRHTKDLYDSYVHDFTFQIDSIPQEIRIKQENVIASEDLVRTLAIFI